MASNFYQNPNGYIKFQNDSETPEQEQYQHQHNRNVELQKVGSQQQQKSFQPKFSVATTPVTQTNYKLKMVNKTPRNINSQIMQQQQQQQQKSQLKQSIQLQQQQQQQQYDQRSVGQNSISQQQNVVVQQDGCTVSGQEKEYNPLSIPANWEIARKHGLARRVAPKIQKHAHVQEICPCCDYEIYRKELSLFDSSMQLEFLGAGFPLFFNFLKYSIVMLVILLLGCGIGGIHLNNQGNFCDYSLQDVVNATDKSKMCVNDGIATLTSVNRIGEPNLGDFPNGWNRDFVLSSVTSIVIMIVLLFFRKSQYVINQKVDLDYLTPADFTVRVSDIPDDDELTLRNVLTNAVFGTEVAKVTFCYNSSKLTEFDSKINVLIKQKQQHIKDQHIFAAHDPVIVSLDIQIENLQRQKTEVSHSIVNGHNKAAHFIGIAYVSFETETQKNNILERVENSQLSFPGGQKLKVSQAAEPSAIIWSSLNQLHNKQSKVAARLQSWLVWAFLVAICFVGILGLKYLQKNFVAQVTSKSTSTTQFAGFLLSALTIAIPTFITIFNKFYFGPELKTRCIAKEMWTTKAKFNIAFSYKLAIGGFVNMVVLIFIQDYFIYDNFYQPGGFIYTADKVFFLNAALTVLIYMIDPWQIQKERQQAKEQKRNKSYLTQEQANELMEYPVYGIARRYSDSLKTLWMTFFFESFMPFGIVYSLIGMVFLYWVDKYNVIKRRTIKDFISLELSTEMIDLMEMIILFQAFGSFYFNYIIFGRFEHSYIIFAVIAVAYTLFPMEKVVQKIWDITPESQEAEIGRFSDNQQNFETDYDRENPIFKEIAKKKFYAERINSIRLETNESV